MITQYSSCYNQFIRSNLREMNPKGYSTSSSRIQVPTTLSSSTTTMFNVELLLSPNQVDGSQGKTPRDKEQMDKLQRRVKQSKRNLTKAIEGFTNRVTSYKMNYPTDDKVEVISAKINDAHSVLKAQDTVYVRYIKLEDEVQNYQNSLNDMEQSEDELDRSISEL